MSATASISVPSFSESTARQIISTGGGIFRGLWNPLPNTLKPLALFDSPQTRSTLALPISRLSVDEVRRHIAESNRKFGVPR